MNPTRNREWSRDLDSLGYSLLNHQQKFSGKMWEEKMYRKETINQFNHRSRTHGIFNHPYVPFDKGKLLSFVYDCMYRIIMAPYGPMHKEVFKLFKCA